jgi:hypothetical protein
MNERKLIREFLDQTNKSYLDNYSHNHTLPDHGEPDCDLNVQDDGTITQQDLFHHFDLDDDGRVTAQEYANHIDYHAAYPETLDRYRELSTVSRESVPCKDTYDSCSSHFMSNPDEMHSIINPIIQMTDSTCIESSLCSIIDVLKCLKEKGLI